jgi:hypothetical protein
MDRASNENSTKISCSKTLFMKYSPLSFKAHVPHCEFSLTGVTFSPVIIVSFPQETN